MQVHLPNRRRLVIRLDVLMNRRRSIAHLGIGVVGVIGIGAGLVGIPNITLVAIAALGAVAASLLLSARGHTKRLLERSLKLGTDVSALRSETVDYFDKLGSRMGKANDRVGSRLKDQTRLIEEVLHAQAGFDRNLESLRPALENEFKLTKSELIRVGETLARLDLSHQDEGERALIAHRRILGVIESLRLVVNDALADYREVVQASDRRLLGTLESLRLESADRYEMVEMRLGATVDNIDDLKTGIDQSSQPARDALKAVCELLPVLARIEDWISEKEVNAQDSEDKVLTRFAALSSEIEAKSDIPNTVALAVSKNTEIMLKAIAKSTLQLTSVSRDETQQVEALLQLVPSLSPRAPLPPSGQWAMDARSLLHLQYLVNKHRPKRILEIGGGTSTAWLGYLVEKWGGSVLSVDHDTHFLNQTDQMIRDHCLTDSVELRHAQLEAQVVEGETYNWYASHAFDGVSDIDFLVIDGPPKKTGKHARFPALPLLIDRLSHCCLVVLDDSQRPDERETLIRWTEMYPAFQFEQIGLDRLGVLSRGS